MKKLLSYLLISVLLFSLLGTAGVAVLAEEKDMEADITLWTYPIGKWGDAETVDGIIARFNDVYPNIKVSVEYLDYQSGDDQVTAAIEAGTTPDIIMEGPERLVSNWGAKGQLLPLNDLWTEEALKDINGVSKSVAKACQWTDENYYEFPLCMVTHCMAINKEVFEEADALKYIDDETRTWSTDDFLLALEALKKADKVPENLIVYCGGQGGDQGTRALVTNLYGAKFTDEDHTKYTIDSEEGKKALEKLVELKDEGLITSDAGIVATDELQLFANGTVAMTICWNASNQYQYADQVEFTPYPVAFPHPINEEEEEVEESEKAEDKEAAEESEDEKEDKEDKKEDEEEAEEELRVKPELCGGIWGFGIFDNKDENKVAAAKEFIKFVSSDPEQGPESVKATGFFPVRKSFGNVYEGTEDEERMEEFSIFMKYLGDYYNVAPNWSEQRTAWWNMLQQVFDGNDIDEALKTYNEAVKAEKPEKDK